MNSSTFSFRREIPVWLAVVIAFAALELVFRVFGARVSDNLARVERIPRQAQALAVANERPRALILGNSLTLEGIDEKLFERELAANPSVKPAIEIIALNGAETAEWYWIVDQQFAVAQKLPDVIVINLDDDFARDIPDVRARRLALYFPVLSTPFVPTVDLPGFELQAEFAIAKCSQAYSRAKTLGAVALGKVIPHYEAGRKWANVQQGAMRRKTASGPPRAPTYERLRRITELASQSDTRVIFVFFPHREDYEIPAPARQIIEQYTNAMLVDARHIPGLTADHFTDKRHLSKKGAAHFTPFYAKLLVDALSAQRPRR
jgi:hypothetical protein